MNDIHTLHEERRSKELKVTRILESGDYTGLEEAIGELEEVKQKIKLILNKQY